MTSKQSEAIKCLEETRASFHELLASLKEDDLARQSVMTRRTVSAVLAHVIMAMETPIPMYIKRARAKKRMPRFFATKVGHWFSFKLSEYRARNTSRAVLAKNYDTAHSGLVDLVKGIEDNEWQLETTMPTRKETISIEQVFSLQVPRHFEAHKKELQKTLGC